MPDNPMGVVEETTAKLRETVKALESEEARLRGELAKIAGQRKAVANALETLTGDKPRRRRGRPRTTTPAAP